MADPEDTNRSAAADPLKRTTVLFTAVLLGAVFAIVVVLTVLRLVEGESLPLLTMDRFREARRQWEANAPANYDIEIKVQGRQASTYQVQVRDGSVRQAWRNGRPLRQQRTRGTWSVPGMFGTIASDLANVQKVADGAADRSTPQLSLRCVFHAEYGYPERYHRTEKVKQGSNPEVSWRVSLFSILESPAG